MVSQFDAKTCWEYFVILQINQGNLLKVPKQNRTRSCNSLSCLNTVTYTRLVTYKIVTALKLTLQEFATLNLLCGVVGLVLVLMSQTNPSSNIWPGQHSSPCVDKGNCPILSTSVHQHFNCDTASKLRHGSGLTGHFTTNTIEQENSLKESRSRQFVLSFSVIQKKTTNRNFRSSSFCCLF